MGRLFDATATVDGVEDQAAELPIIDVSAYLLADVVTSDDSALRQSIRQILTEIERSAPAISGWASYID